MKNVKIFRSLAISIAVIVCLALINGFAAAARLAAPPTYVQVHIFQLDGGSIHEDGGTPAACNTPDNQDKWGCTAFYMPPTPQAPPATVALYPFGSVAAPTLSLDNEYLKDVIPAEMIVSIAPTAALQAQAIAARSVGWHNSGNLDNSTNDQVFVPYAFEFLRKGFQTEYNPMTPSPNLSDCTVFSSG